ncbi:hypothetical protein MNBD_GAMMA19-2160 [hydrothermal vent metagenome]|uniref:Outer membrane protein beta-barrel domain-containing protein n=1 Tax=hydrothermal vent metagenome TaxID=652676 RepID=A0A3B1AW70_9ZZZZ
MKKYLLWLLLCISSSVAYADEEDWYTYWAIGAVNHDYPGGLNSMPGSMETAPGVDRTEMAFDMFGFYWPQSENSLLGFVISGSVDRFESRSSELQITQNLLGISSMRFFGSEIGDGFFVRVDAGLAQVTLEDNFLTVTSERGFGYLLGVGYAFPVSNESRILVGVSFSDKQVNFPNGRVGNSSWKSTTLTVGGLW